jgi:hypothetical protein
MLLHERKGSPDELEVHHQPPGIDQGTVEVAEQVSETVLGKAHRAHGILSSQASVKENWSGVMPEAGF